MNKYKTNRFAGLDLLQSCSKAKVEKEQVTDISLACFEAMLEFKAGRGNEQHWHTLAYCLNIAMCLTELDVMPEGLNAIQHGQNALDGVAPMDSRLGSHAFAINCAVNIFLKQIKMASNQQVKRAENEVLKRNEQSRRVAEDESLREKSRAELSRADDHASVATSA